MAEEVHTSRKRERGIILVPVTSDPSLKIVKLEYELQVQYRLMTWQAVKPVS